MRQTSIPFLLLLALITIVFMPAGARAQTSGCIPGLPCDVDATPDDPKDPNDGPNKKGPNKSKSDSAACDADFMNQIYARAFLESTREATMNQATIRKPDSILEYTCFDTQITNFAPQAGGVFSDSPPPPGASGPYKVSDIVQNLMQAALSKYIENNFSHAYLGGTSSATPSSGTCDVMNTVYNAAKCDDMDQSPFFTFSWLASNDPRLYPQDLSCNAPPIQQNIIDLAENKNFQYVNFDQPYADPVQKVPYSDFLNYSPCKGPAIPTGLIVTIPKQGVSSTGPVNYPASQDTTFDDKACPNPGCHYAGKNQGCVP